VIVEEVAMMVGMAGGCVGNSICHWNHPNVSVVI
jgi:hypothetical protein